MLDRKVKYAFDKVIKRGKVRKCLLAGKECFGRIIEAHSIQNSTILQELSEDGHVYTLRPDLENPKVNLKYVGRNVASTFTGFCSFHDMNLFSEIDFNINNVPEHFTERQMTLFFLRAIAIEGWKKQNIVNSFEEMAMALQQDDFKKVSQVLGIPEELAKKAIKNPAAIIQTTLGQIKGLEDMESMLGSLIWQVRKAKFRGTINHHIKLNSQSHVAVSSGFSPLCDIKGKSLYNNLYPSLNEKMCHMGLTVFESKGKTNILISYLKKDENVLHSLASQVNELAKKEEKFKVWLTEFILENCENIVFRPSYIDSLTVEQKAELEAAAEWNLLSPEPPKKNISFCFFT